MQPWAWAVPTLCCPEKEPTTRPCLFTTRVQSRSTPWQVAEEILSLSSSSDPTVKFRYLYQDLRHQTLAGNEILTRSEPLYMTNCLSGLHDKCHCQCCGLHSLNGTTKPDSVKRRWSYMSICVCTFGSVLLLFKISCSDRRRRNWDCKDLFVLYDYF